MTKFLRLTTTWCFRRVGGHGNVEVGELEELHVALVVGLLLHDLAWDLAQYELDSSGGRLVGHRVVEAHLPLPAEDVQLLRLERHTLLDASCDLVDRHRRIHGADVDERACPLLPWRCCMPAAGLAP